MKLTRLKFKNGFAIDLIKVQDGKQYYRQWSPGVETMSLIHNLHVMPSDAFWKQVREERAKETAAPSEANA